jgi:hypothetical protein
MIPWKLGRLESIAGGIFTGVFEVLSHPNLAIFMENNETM